MKSINRGAAAVCGMLMFGAAAHADQLQDIDSDSLALNVGDSMSGQFVANSTLIDFDRINGATLALTLADDGEATTPTTGESNTNINTYTNTINGVRTVTTTYTSTAYFLDEEMDSVQIIFGNQTQDATIEGGTVSYLGEHTVAGPTPVPAEDCTITFGYYTSCATVTITNVNYSLSGYTGENVVFVQLDGAALQTFKQTGTVDYTVTATAGDLSVKSATLDVSLEPVSNVTFDDYEPQSLDGMFDVNAVNNSGVVVGQMDRNTADGWRHAAVWENGTLTDLGMAGCRDTVSECWSHAYGINDQGQIVGESFTDLSWPSQYFGPWSMYYAHEVMWQDANSPMEFMHTVGWEYGKTLDINAQGHAVGHGRSVDWQTANGDYFVHGYLWRSNTDVVEFGEYGQTSKAFALNDNDQVVGEIDENGATQAFFWDNGVLTTLGHFGGGQSTAVDINNAGQVVGSAKNSNNQWRAFMWQNGFLYELETLPDTISSHAYAINNSGLIVGEMDGRAVAWKGGKLFELNDYVDESYGLTLTKAVAVNNKGQIVARTAAADSFQLLSIVEPPPPGDVTVCPSGCDYTSIQDGINAAGSGNTVLVYYGTYNEMVTINGGITVKSWKGPSETVIDATGLGGSAVTLNNGTIEGFTITGGTATYGGGISMRSGTVQNNIITGNNASYDGGGLYVGSRYSNALIQNNTFSNNQSARYGGAIAHGSYTTVTMLNNTFTGNTAVRGGAVFLGAYSTLTFNSNVVKGNTASYMGGGVYISGYSTGKVVNSLITENTAGFGGGVGFAAYTGGQLVNSTVVNNSSGIGVAAYSSPTITNSIVWGNTDFQISRQPTVTYSIVEGGFSGDGNLDSDPLFANAANGDYHLMSGSPAIDSGANTSASGVTSDFDGNARPADGDGLGAGTTGDGSDYDIGAYEFQ
jgi:probable HAF family extracellular repeat protein/parallel beta-helix repeat protein